MRMRSVNPGQSRRPTIQLFERRSQDRLANRSLLILSTLPFALIALIFGALLRRFWPILSVTPLWDLLTGQVWKPIQGLFGYFPFIMGTIWVTAVTMILTVPPCLLAAIYLVEYAGSKIKALIKPLLDLLAAIPSVVYGVWGLVAIVPWVQGSLAPFSQRYLGFIPFFHTENPTGFSVIAGSLVLAVMVTPFIIAMTYEVLQTVPDGMRQASLAMGATRWQTVRYAVIPQSLPGIIASVVLGASRALGETMAVLMVVGNVAKVPGSIFDPAYPLPALIANNYGEMMSIPLYDAALLGAALVLLVMVLTFNIASTLVLRHILRRKKS